MGTRNKNTTYRYMHEIEDAEQDDPINPDGWIYHKDWALDRVLSYIRKSNEELMKDDESFGRLDGLDY